MPELPDVDVYRQYLDSTALHQRIEQVNVASPEILHGASPQGLGRVLKGKALNSSCRHGKYLFIAIEKGDLLVMHFGMTGHLKYYKHQEEKPDYTQVLISFENGYHLAYAAPRKLGQLAVISSPEAFLHGHKIGPDALSLGEKQFLQLASDHRGKIKSLLMDQRHIAGIGNIYSDEILFQARIHPESAVKDLDEARLKRLYQAMNSVLRSAIEANMEVNNMPDAFLLSHRANGEQCPRCHGHVEKRQISGRTSWFCPHCQKK